MLAKAVLPRAWTGLVSRNLSLSCQTNRSKKTGDSSKIKKDTSKIEEDISNKPEDSSKEFDDSWKWNSNYFKNHWNRETFGPPLTK